MSNQFAFSNSMALRIANFHSNCIEGMAMDFGISFPKNWPQQLPKPAKPHLAELVTKELINLTDTGLLSASEVNAALDTAESRTKAHEANRKGRPLMHWTNLTEFKETYTVDFTNSEADYTGTTSNTNTKPNADVQAVLDELGEQAIPAKPPVQAAATQTQQTETRSQMKVERKQGDIIQNAIADMIEATINSAEFAEHNKAQGVDEAAVNKLIQQAIKAHVLPTIVHVERKTVDGATNTQNLGMQHKLFPMLLEFIKTGFPVWMPGPAGSGKTTAAMNVAKALDLPFHFNGAIDTEYKLLGFTDAGGTFHETPFYRAYKNGGVYLFDEVDASNPQALVAMNAALENGHCVFGNGECITKHADFYVIAAANTYGSGATHEYVGRNKLDAATVDRFIMLSWEYDEQLERALAGNDTWVNTVQGIRAKLKTKGIKHVVSPRASIRGAALLAAGVNQDTVLDAVVYKGMSDDVRRSMAY